MNAARKPDSILKKLSPSGVLDDSLRNGVIVVDAKLKIRAFSTGAERFAGVQASQALNRDFRLLPTPLRRLVTRVSTTGKPIDGHQIALPTSSGKTIVRVTAVPVQAGKARPGVVLVLNDLATARHFEQKLSRLDRLASIGTLSAGMTHEIKNALVSVKTFIDLLLDKNQDAELAGIVRREMGRINSLVSRTLKFAGPARPTLSSVRLHEVLDHSLRMVEPQIQSKRITSHRFFRAVSDVVRGDDYQIEQVFVDLLLNAVEATGTHGSLTVSTEIIPSSQDGRARRKAASQLRVSVTDTGPGIKPENMSRLFEPFFTTKENGTGLGLAIARQIVESHHGEIEVRSEFNKGTTFSVTLPSQAAEA